MPELDFRVMSVEPATRGLAPLLHFKVAVSNTPVEQRVHTGIIQSQIHIEATRRSYGANEKEKLVELFGTPERWGQTLRRQHWANANTTLPSFTGNTEVILPVPCTYDLNVSATKYFYGLEDGEVPLLFLFSGTVFYAAEDGRLQAQQISWEKESVFRMPVRIWQQIMDVHYPNSAWLSLPRDTFERLCAFKREMGLTSWDQVIEQLLPEDRSHAIALSGQEARP